jgi:hypothetical protein
MNLADIKKEINNTKEKLKIDPSNFRFLRELEVWLNRYSEELMKLKPPYDTHITWVNSD